MADATGDLDNFFARKDKKKKGTQSGEKGKKRSNAKESSAPDSSVLAETPNENDEWATIQDDISKSIMTIEGVDINNSSSGQKPSNDNAANEEDASAENADGQPKPGPWKIQESSDQGTGENKTDNTTAETAAASNSTPSVASSSSVTAASSGAYIPPRLRQKQAAAAGSVPVRKKPELPPDVSSKSDFPSLASASGNPAVDTNPWQQRSGASATASNGVM